MKIRNYDTIDTIPGYGRSTYLNEEKLFKELKYFDTKKYMEDFKNKNIENYIYIHNRFEVIYYITGIKKNKNIVLLFKRNEYDLIESVLKRFIRNEKLNLLTKVAIDNKNK
jgi:NADH:ubiquinone oxidoreductase subunit C